MHAGGCGSLPHGTDSCRRAIVVLGVAEIMGSVCVGRS